MSHTQNGSNFKNYNIKAKFSKFVNLTFIFHATLLHFVLDLHSKREFTTWQKIFVRFLEVLSNFRIIFTVSHRFYENVTFIFHQNTSQSTRWQSYTHTKNISLSERRAQNPSASPTSTLPDTFSIAAVAQVLLYSNYTSFFSYRRYTIENGFRANLEFELFYGNE